MLRSQKERIRKIRENRGEVGLAAIEAKAIPKIKIQELVVIPKKKTTIRTEEVVKNEHKNKQENVNKNEHKNEHKNETSYLKALTDEQLEKVQFPKATVSHKVRLNLDFTQYPEVQDNQGCWAAAMAGLFNFFTGKKLSDTNALDIKKIRNTPLVFRDTNGQEGYNGKGLEALQKPAAYVIQKHTKKDGSLDFQGIEKVLASDELKNQTDLCNEIRDYVQTVKDLQERIASIHEFKDKSGKAGNIFVTADVLLDNLARAGKQAGVKLTVFNPLVRKIGEAFEEVDSRTNKIKTVYKATAKQVENAKDDIVRYKNQFLDVVAESLGKNSPVAILCGGHYLTITGIDGENLEYIHSLPQYGVFKQSRGTITVDEVLKGYRGRQIELTALEPVTETKEELTNKYKNLRIDEQGNVISKVNNGMFGEDKIAHTKGVDIENSASERNNDRPDIHYGQMVYFPKKLTFTK